MARQQLYSRLWTMFLYQFHGCFHWWWFVSSKWQHKSTYKLEFENGRWIQVIIWSTGWQKFDECLVWTWFTFKGHRISAHKIPDTYQNIRRISARLDIYLAKFHFTHYKSQVNARIRDLYHFISLSAVV